MALMKKQIPITTTAEVVDDSLVLSCPNAVQPVVWRMEVEKIGTASFEVKVNQKDDTAKLVLKPKKGTAELIADFATKDEAVNALMATSDALQTSKNQSPKKALKKIAQGAPQHIEVKASSSKWPIVLVALLLVIGLYVYMISLMPDRTTFESTSSATSSSVSSPQSSTGVPVDANDFLKGL